MFDEQLVGKDANKEYSFSADYKDDYYLKEVAGKTVDFTVTVTEIKKKETAELTDALVAELSPYKTVDELKTNVRENLETKRKQEVDEKLKQDLLNAIVEAHTIDLPEGLVTYEMGLDRKYYENTLKQSGSTLAQYLELTKQSEEDFNKQLRENSVTRIKQDLVIEAVQRQENLEASEADIKAEIKTLKPEADTDEKVAEEMKKINLEGFKTMLSRKKALDFLVEHAKIKVKK